MGPKHAVILAGGIGSRMLPASSLVPKEIMPLIDVPAITYLINEIKETGIKEIHLVVNEQKVWIADLLNYNNKNINQLQEIRDDISSSILNPLENINLNVDGINGSKLLCKFKGWKNQQANEQKG